MSEQGPTGELGTGPAGGALVAGRYRVHERVGAGGMGVVYRATDTRLKRQVALKRVVLRGLDDDEAAEARRRTLREAEIAARVHHPRIVTVFDVLDDPGGPVLVLEYLPSRSLGAVAADVGLLTPGPVARVGAQIAEALAAAHAAGIVHRDVKPGNVLVAPGDPLGPAKLADFGISHVPELSTATASGIGTPAYFAPEIARGERPGPPADVYALGATLVALLRGAPPFGRGDGNPLELIRRIAQDPVPDPAVGGPLGELLARMTDADPARRPTAERAAAGLWPLADRPEPFRTDPPPEPGRSAAPDDVTDLPPRAATRPGTGQRWYRRRNVLALGALVAAVVVVGGVVVGGAVAGGAAVGTGATGGSGDAPAAPGPVVVPARFPATVPPLTVGDPRTADPCSPVRPEALSGYGRATPVPDYDRFAICVIDVAQQGSDVMQVSTEFLPPALDLPKGDRQRLGDAWIVRSRTEDGGCQRFLVLSDGTPIDVRTRFYGSGDPVADPCAVAETAVASAATTVATTGVGRRVPPSGGLWDRDACTLLTPADLTLLPADRRAEPDRGFAGWTCAWDDGNSPGLGVTVSFVRYAPPDQDGVAVPGTPVFLHYDADDRCSAEIGKRTYRSTFGDPLAETLRVLVQGPLPRQQLCDQATRLGVAANARS